MHSAAGRARCTSAAGRNAPRDLRSGCAGCLARRLPPPPVPPHVDRCRHWTLALARQRRLLRRKEVGSSASPNTARIDKGKKQFTIRRYRLRWVCAPSQVTTKSLLKTRARCLSRSCIWQKVNAGVSMVKNQRGPCVARQKGTVNREVT